MIGIDGAAIQTASCSQQDGCAIEDYPVELHAVISQYQDSPNLKAYIDTFVDRGREIINDIETLSLALAVDCVKGEALDQIGRIVGQERIWYDPNSIPWFAFEGSPNPLRMGFDNGKLWDGITSLTGNFIEADDSTHRMFVKAKMAKNNFDGTVNGMLDSLFLVTCRTDIRINTGNGLADPVFVMENGIYDSVTGGWSVGAFFGAAAAAISPMKFTIETSLAKPIDETTKQFILNYGLLPRPAGVDLVDVLP